MMAGRYRLGLSHALSALRVLIDWFLPPLYVDPEWPILRIGMSTLWRRVENHAYLIMCSDRPVLRRALLQERLQTERIRHLLCRLAGAGSAAARCCGISSILTSLFNTLNAISTLILDNRNSAASTAP